MSRPSLRSASRGDATTSGSVSGGSAATPAQSADQPGANAFQRLITNGTECARSGAPPYLRYALRPGEGALPAKRGIQRFCVRYPGRILLKHI